MIGRRPQFDRPYSEKACRACVPCAQRSKNVRWEHRRPSPDLQTDEVLTHGKKANFCLRNYKPFTFLGGNVYLVGCRFVEVQTLHCSSEIGLSATLRKEVAAVPLLFPHCRCLSLGRSVSQQFPLSRVPASFKAPSAPSLRRNLGVVSEILLLQSRRGTQVKKTSIHMYRDSK